MSQNALIKFIVNGNLIMHIKQTQYDQASMNMTMKHSLMIHEQSLYIVTTMNIYTVNEHLDMQENKLNAKYHLHVTLNRCNNTKAIASRLQDPTRAQEY